jgi:hypothetical protein
VGHHWDDEFDTLLLVMSHREERRVAISFRGTATKASVEITGAENEDQREIARKAP